MRATALFLSQCKSLAPIRFFPTWQEETPMPEKKAVLVVGAGDATGGAIARRFAREGYAACVTRRNADKLAPLVE